MKKPKGTKDLFGKDIKKYRQANELLFNLANEYGFTEMKTPTFEYAETFKYNDESLVAANKELFYLKNDKYTLRPENTSSIIRACISNKLLSNNKELHRIFYSGSMFRFERPQLNRYREFFQFGLELINAKSINHDIELIYMISSFLSKLGIKTKLYINYLGIDEQKLNWNIDLKKYLQNFKHLFSEEENLKIEKNTLRVLDINFGGNIKIQNCLDGAPTIKDFLSDEQKNNVLTIKNKLKELNINFEWKNNLVRGIDYYTGLVYEWCFEDQAMIAGGRYNQLYLKFSKNEDIPCLGLAIGLERLIYSLDKSNYEWKNEAKVKIYFMNLINDIPQKIFQIIKEIRSLGYIVVTNWDICDLKSHFKFAQKEDIPYLIFFGEVEKKEGSIILKQQNSPMQVKIFISRSIPEILKQIEYFVDE